MTPQIFERQRDKDNVQEPWITWGIRLLQAIQSSDGDSQIDLWLKNNRLIMEVMSEESPEEFAKLQHAIAMARTRHRR